MKQVSGFQKFNPGIYDEFILKAILSITKSSSIEDASFSILITETSLLLVFISYIKVIKN